MKIHFPFLNSILVLGFILILYGFTRAQTNPKLIFTRDIKPLKTNGRWIVNAGDGQRRMLRGVNVSGMEYDSLGRKVNLPMLAELVKSTNINIVRLPVNQDWWLRNLGGTYCKLIEERINFLASKKIYTLLDLQWIDTKLKIDSLPNDLSIEFWKQAAAQFKNQPSVLFDIYNEPRNCEHKAWAAKASLIIEAIRSVHPESLVFVNGIDWGYDLSGFIEKPLNYPNIVYGTHIYPQKPGSGYKKDPEYAKYWLGMLQKNLPVFAGEFGPEEGKQDNADQMDHYLKQLLAQFTQSQIGYTAWSWTNSPFLTSEGSGNPKQLTSFGQLVISHIQKTSK